MTNQQDRDMVIRDHMQQIAEHQRHIREHEANLEAMAPPTQQCDDWAEWKITDGLLVVATPTYTSAVNARQQAPATIADETGDHTYQLCAALIAAKNWRNNQ